MVNYSLSINQPHKQYIQFSAEFKHDGISKFKLQLPTWRPGRYELGNFAKYIKNFRAYNPDGNKLQTKKVSKDSWVIEAKDEQLIYIDYEFYASILNAGSTFLNEDILYVNPVNCFMYRPGFEEADSFSVSLNVPSDYILASPLAGAEKKEFVAKNVHELMDSPFMTSPNLEHHSFLESGCNFHLWINGTHELDLSKIEADFRPFCKAQISDFNGIPVDDYLFLFHFLDMNSYHGVEHEKCTVITLGPAKKLLERTFYEELLGVSSHELYHTWNVKAMRPKDMLPYDYTKENYSELGFIYEGVTTYMGDVYLNQSKVFTFDQYTKHLGSYLVRHFHNEGRLNYSVSESSFDTWLDGYVAGAPGRKVSIYTEGCLIALICDLNIVNSSNGEKSLKDAMSLLWEEYGKKGIGYTAENYFEALEKTATFSLDEIKDKLIYGSADFTPFLREALDFIGLDLLIEEK